MQARITAKYRQSASANAYSCLEPRWRSCWPAKQAHERAGKTDAIILDHANNFAQHGAVDRDRRWTLSRDRAITDSQSPPEKACPECGVVCLLGVTECPECSHMFPRTSVSRQERTGRLAEVRDDYKQSRRELFFDLVEVALTARTRDGKRYQPSYAVAEFRELTGSWPPGSWQREASLR
jgi:hypothetical protein